MHVITRFIENHPQLDTSLSEQQPNLPSFLGIQDIRSLILNILGPERSHFEMTCKFFWAERHLQYIDNGTDLSKYLSWIIYENRPELLSNFECSKIPIRLEIPLYIGNRAKCIKKVIEKFSKVDSITILQKEYPHGVVLKDKMTNVDDLCNQLSELTLNSNFSAKKIKKFHFPKGIQRLSLVNQDLKNAKAEDGGVTKLSSETPFLFQSAKFDLNSIFRKCTQLQELDLAGGCLNFNFFVLGGKLPATLRHLSLVGTQIISEHLGNIFLQCPELRSLDIMWNKGIRQDYSYYELSQLTHLERFAISREPTVYLLNTLSRCNLLSVVVEHIALTDVWLGDAAKPFLSKLPEMVIDKRDQNHPVVNQLQEKYPDVKITFYTSL